MQSDKLYETYFEQERFGMRYDHGLHCQLVLHELLVEKRQSDTVNKKKWRCTVPRGKAQYTTHMHNTVADAPSAVAKTSPRKKSSQVTANPCTETRSNTA